MWNIIVKRGFMIKNILKNERACKDIKTKKAQKQDWVGTLATKLN